jgi:hypothetical protein
MPAAAGWALTMLFVAVGWVLFRAARFSTAAEMLLSMTGLNGFGGSFRGAELVGIGAILSVLIPSAHEIKDQWAMPAPGAVAALAILMGFCVLEVGKGPPLPFVYFQF